MKHFLRPTLMAAAAAATLGMTVGAHAQSTQAKPVDKTKDRKSVV